MSTLRQSARLLLIVLELINRVLATYAQMKIAEVKLNDRRAERYLQWERDG